MKRIKFNNGNIEIYVKYTNGETPSHRKVETDEEGYTKEYLYIFLDNVRNVIGSKAFKEPENPVMGDMKICAAAFGGSYQEFVHLNVDFDAEVWVKADEEIGMKYLKYYYAGHPSRIKKDDDGYVCLKIRDLIAAFGPGITNMAERHVPFLDIKMDDELFEKMIVSRENISDKKEREKEYLDAIKAILQANNKGRRH